MAWKSVGLPLAEFLGGLGALRIGVPMENIPVVAVGMALTWLGLSGLVKPLSKPQQRTYQ